MQTLAALNLDTTQITIVTPHPQTEMWRELDSNFGIYEKDWSTFDTKHLVWNHPHCAQGVPETLLEAGFRRCYGKDWPLRTAKKFLSMRRKHQEVSSVLMGPVRSHWASPEKLPFLAARVPASPNARRGGRLNEIN